MCTRVREQLKCAVRTRTASMTDTAFPRAIKSYVLRSGRLTPAQQRALDALWPRWGVEYQGQVRDLDALFGRRAPRILEVGFGNGEQLLHSALHDADSDYLGIEVHKPGVGRLLNALEAHGCTQVRLYAHDAVEVLGREIPDAALNQVRIYFPDPWPKARHHKRRLVQPEFIALVARKLRPGGLLHLATDWQPYAEHMLAVLGAEPTLRNTASDGAFAERPAWRVATHFERRGLVRGHGVWDLLYRRE